MSRLERLGESLEEPLLVTNGVNVRYLTGFASSNTALLVEPGGASTLYTDFRYAESARRVAGVTFVQTPRDVGAALAELLTGRRVGFEAATIAYAQWELLGAGGLELVPTRGIVERLRAVKDATELNAIRHASAISDDVFDALAAERFTGRTEGDLAWWIERALRERGAEALAFGSVVASAANGALPHANPGTDVIPADTLVTVDIGCVVDGYCSDCTRTFATGSLPSELDDAYRLVQQAQLDGLAAVKSGASGGDADAASRTAIEQAGLGDRYGHGLGHGVGLEVHEGPTMRPSSEDVLEPGNVVSVEPGLYLPGIGGCRIEDLVVVTENGCEILTLFTKELPDRRVGILRRRMAEIVNTNQFKTGMHIEHRGGVWRIVDFQHVKPGKGGAFVRTKLKNLDTGAVVDDTFRAGEKFARVHTEMKNVQFLYDDGNEAHFMVEETFEQFGIERSEVEEELAYILPSSTVQMLAVNGKPSGISLPASVELAVSDTEPGVKGDTVSNVTKPATLETGAVVQVPLFVNVGDRIKVDPSAARYISRA